MKVLLSVLVSIILMSCTENIETKTKSNVEPLDNKRAMAFENFDNKSCKAKGGEVKPVGKAQFPACVISFNDGGKACVDKIDCKGRCVLINEIVDKGLPMKGICEYNNDRFGCSQEIIKGLTQSGICVD